MLTKPPLPPTKPDLRVISQGPRKPAPLATTLLARQALAQPVEPLDRRKIRLRWD